MMDVTTGDLPAQLEGTRNPLAHTHGSSLRLGLVSALMLLLTTTATACGQTDAAQRAAATPPAAAGASTFAKGWNPMTWKKPGDDVLKQSLTPLQYSVTQREDTEQPFHNEYWDNHAAGIYVDVVSGEPLFSSLDKFDSGTGWPSFTRPLEKDNITEKTDRKLVFKRTEVRSKHADSHLGHVFDDSPAPAGLRYCMNSAALRFIPVDRLEAEGYAQYLPLFEKTAAR